MYQQYGGRAHFYLIYIREAHPADGWQVGPNIEEGWVINEPVTWEERRGVAEAFVAEMKLSIPILVDGMDNKTESDYEAWPDRIYIVDEDGKVAYKGAKGPWGFDPMQIIETLETLTEVGSVGRLIVTWGAIRTSL